MGKLEEFISRNFFNGRSYDELTDNEKSKFDVKLQEYQRRDKNVGDDKSKEANKMKLKEDEKPEKEEVEKQEDIEDKPDKEEEKKKSKKSADDDKDDEDLEKEEDMEDEEEDDEEDAKKKKKKSKKSKKGEGNINPEESEEDAEDINGGSQGTPSAKPTNMNVAVSSVDGKREQVIPAGKSVNPDLIKSPLFTELSSQLDGLQKSFEQRFEALEKSFKSRIDNVQKTVGKVEKFYKQPFYKSADQGLGPESIQKQSISEQIEKGQVRYRE